jgi:hypothetical protein
MIKYLKMAVAAALVAASAYAALALNLDQTRTFPVRQFATQQTAYHRVTINYNDPNIGLAQQFGTLNTNQFVVAITCQVTTAFNAGSTNVVTLGTTKASANEIVSSGGSATTSITANSATFQPLTTAIGLGVAVTSAGQASLYAKYAQTGTPATAGSVICVIETVQNNDN